MAAFRACPRKMAWEHIHHFKPRTPNVHLHAGGAYAHGLEVARRAFFERGEPAEDSVAMGLQALMQFYGSFECPEDSPKSLERTAGALLYYFERYPLEEEKAIPSHLADRRGIEFSFTEPLPIDHPETGEPLLYCGRMDQIVDFAGARYGEDDKTTSQLGASWPRQWDLRSQFTGYCWGAARAGYPLQGFIIRGVSILKTKYDTLEAITYRPQFMIDRWEAQLLRDVKRAIQCWEEGYWDYNLDESCQAFGGCIFRKACMSDDPQPWLEVDFIRRKWDPVTRKETDL